MRRSAGVRQGEEGAAQGGADALDMTWDSFGWSVADHQHTQVVIKSSGDMVLRCNRDMPLVRTIQISSTRAKKPDSVFFMGSVCQSVSLCQCGCSSQIHSKALHCMHIHSTVIHIYPALICAGTTKGTRFFGHQKSTKHEHVNIQSYSHCAANIHCFMHEHYYTIASLIGTGSSCVDELGFLARFPKGLSGGVFVNLDGHAIATMSYAADEVVAEWVKA